MNPKDANVRWRKSARSGGNGGECVEVASTLSTLRDSKNPGSVLAAPVAGLLRAIKADRFS